MARWLPSVLPRIHRLAAERKVRFTLKATRELALVGFGLDLDDAVDILVGLSASDSAGRLVSEHTGEWMYVFEQRVAGGVLYVKLVLRSDFVVVSFHEEASDRDPEEEA